ncbi:YkvA family protein [Chryseomicrobium palamuruense]|uniref:YkvA family protein n=1 Tax=Chryseomicrobium palamuruense TaxID=682973 RepID=A0ABV8UW73_9BACL
MDYTSEQQLDFYERLRKSITTYFQKKGMTKVTSYLLFAPDIFHLMVKSFTDPRIDFKSKALLGSGIAYFIAPVDFLPELLAGPGGFVDDLLIATFVLNLLVNRLTPEVIEEHWAGDDELMGTLKRLTATGESILGKLPTKSLIGQFMKRSPM